MICTPTHHHTSSHCPHCPTVPLPPSPFLLLAMLLSSPLSFLFYATHAITFAAAACLVHSSFPSLCCLLLPPSSPYHFPSSIFCLPSFLLLSLLLLPLFSSPSHAICSGQQNWSTQSSTQKIRGRKMRGCSYSHTQHEDEMDAEEDGFTMIYSTA